MMEIQYVPGLDPATVALIERQTAAHYANGNVPAAPGIISGGPCVHFNDAPIERKDCGSCQQNWIYPCDVHGQCSPTGWHPETKRCVTCAQYHPASSETEPKVARRITLINDCCPGDVTVMSAAVESLHAAHPGDYITAYAGTAPELFDHNPHISPMHAGHNWEPVKLTYPLIDRCDDVPVHFMNGYCKFLEDLLGKPVPLAVNRPHLYLAPEEQGWISQVAELTGGHSRYWLVNAGYKDDYPAKWWGTTNFQRVIDMLRGRVLFVQIGEASHAHPPLAGVLDVRGKTDTRQLMRMVYHAAGGLGPSTFLQHLCAGFEKPYICLAGGREPLAWQHYPRQATLSTVGVTPCSASRAGRSCWKDRASASPDKPGASLCELPVISGGGELITACLESLRPERVAEEILARYNTGSSIR